jgi:hypothetical protein
MALFFNQFKYLFVDDFSQIYMPEDYVNDNNSSVYLNNSISY